MDPNLGSGSQLLGGGNDALSQVMQQAGIGTGQTQMQTPASAGFDPSIIQQGPPQGAPQAPQAPQPPTGAVGLPQGSPEANIIIEALHQRLSSISKTEEMAAKAQLQPPTPPIQGGLA